MTTTKPEIPRKTALVKKGPGSWCDPTKIPGHCDFIPGGNPGGILAAIQILEAIIVAGSRREFHLDSWQDCRQE